MSWLAHALGSWLFCCALRMLTARRPDSCAAYGTTTSRNPAAAATAVSQARALRPLGCLPLLSAATRAQGMAAGASMLTTATVREEASDGDGEGAGEGAAAARLLHAAAERRHACTRHGGGRVDARPRHGLQGGTRRLAR